MTVQLDSPLYTLGDWSGNVRDNDGVEWVVEGEDGWSSSPPVRPTVAERSTGDGAWAGPGFYGARVITLAGRALATDRLSMLNAKERIKAAVGPRNLVPLQVDEAHLSRVAQVRLTDKIEISDRGAHSFAWQLILTAPDPRRYSVDEMEATAILPTTSTGGRTYPRTYPMAYGSAVVGGSGSANLTQLGDFDETPAVVTFTGPLINPSVAHVQTGRTLTFELTLAAEETLVVDLGEQTALLNGSASRANTISPGSAWFLLVPGANELQFRGQAGTPAEIQPTMTVTASSAWT